MRRHVPLACLLAVVAVGGCVGLFGGGGGDVDPATVDERVEAQLGDVETLVMTMNQTVRTPNETFSTRFRIRYERPGRVNFTVLDGRAPWAYVLSNESGTWLYNDSADRLTYAPQPLVDDPRDLFYGVGGIGPNATFEGNETLAGEDAIELSYAASDSEFSLVVGGEATSQFNRSEANGSLRTRVWMDTDLWLPRKTQVTLTALEPNRTLTFRYSDVTVDGEIPEGTFTVDVPPETEVRRGDRSNFRVSRENATFFDSRSALASATNRTVPEPSVPPDYRFERGALLDGRHPGIELTYTNGTSLIEVVTIGARESFVSGGTVSVGGANGTYAELPQAGIVQWHCGDETRLVITQEDRETLLSIAESVGCGG